MKVNTLSKFMCHTYCILDLFFQNQVAVALSHAAILEESMRARDLLMEQNVALDFARREAETAIRARNDFLAVMNHEMRTPMHAIIALSSLLLETELTPEQRLMVETILKSSNLLATLINDVLDLSRLEDGSLKLDINTFSLHALLSEVWIRYNSAFIWFLCISRVEQLVVVSPLFLEHCLQRSLLGHAGSKFDKAYSICEEVVCNVEFVSRFARVCSW